LVVIARFAGSKREPGGGGNVERGIECEEPIEKGAPNGGGVNNDWGLSTRKQSVNKGLLRLERGGRKRGGGEGQIQCVTGRLKTAEKDAN